MLFEAFVTPVKFVIEKWSNHISKLWKSMNFSKTAQNILRTCKAFLLMKWMSKLTFDLYHHMIELFFRHGNSVVRITCTRKFLVLNYPWFIFVIWDDLDGIINLNIWTRIIYHWKLGCFGLSLLIQSTKDMDYFGSSDENKKIFDTMPNLKCVSTVSAGYDHLGMVIDEHKWHFHWVDQDASSRCPWFLVGRVLSKFKERPQSEENHEHFKALQRRQPSSKKKY